MFKLALILFSFPVLALADDIDLLPWGMYQQNANHTGYVKSKINVESFHYDWKILVGQAGGGTNYYLSQPVVAGNIVYVTRSHYYSNNTLQAFSIKDGHEIWRKDYDTVAINPPSVVDGIVYVQTVANNSPMTALYGYDAVNGKILFKAPMSAQSYHYLSPTVYDHHVYTNGGTYGGMYAFDAKLGDQTWFARLPQYDLWTPAVNEEYAIAYTDGHLNVVDRASGKNVIDIADPNFKWSGYSSNFAPVLINDHQALTISSGYLSLFDITAGNIVWSAGSNYTGQPVYDGETIYASRNDGLMALDKSGKLLWQWYQDNELVRGGMLVTKNLIFITTDQKVYAISKETHEPVWEYSGSGTLSMGMGHLYILDYAGYLTSISVESVA